MAAGRIVIPQWMPALSANGIPIPNAKIFFYQNNTTTLKTVYADEALTTPLANPVVANAAGHFPNIWGDDQELYSATVSAPYGPPGVPFTHDDLRPGTAAGGSSGVNRGAWDADTNTPTITSGTGEEGDFYTVAVAGTTALDGITEWAVGDQALFKGGVWTKVEAVSGGINMGAWNAATNTPVISDGAGRQGEFYTVEVAGNTTVDGVGPWAVGDQIRFDGGAWTKVPRAVPTRQLGSWNAATNTPTITPGVGKIGDFYIVSVSGNTAINGVTRWNVGDMILFNGTVWTRNTPLSAVPRPDQDAAWRLEAGRRYDTFYIPDHLTGNFGQVAGWGRPGHPGGVFYGTDRDDNRVGAMSFAAGVFFDQVNATTNQGGEGLYIEVRNTPASSAIGSRLTGMEINPVTLGTALNPTPTTVNSNNLVYALKLSAGRPDVPGSTHISSYIACINNGAAAHAGLLFQSEAFTSGWRALAMAPHHRVGWYTGTSPFAYEDAGYSLKRVSSDGGSVRIDMIRQRTSGAIQNGDVLGTLRGGYNNNDGTDVIAGQMYFMKDGGSATRAVIQGTAGDGAGTAFAACLGGVKSWSSTGDNIAALGGASNRWTQVYAATGTINTSDARTKTEVDVDWAAVLRAIRAVDIKTFKWDDAISDKGVENARVHTGIMAQDLIAAFEAEGLDPFRFAVIGHDPWMEEVEVEVEAEEPVTERVEVEDIQYEVMPDGSARQVVTSKFVDNPVYETLPVFDDNGDPVWDQPATPGVAVVENPDGQEPIRRTATPEDVVGENGVIEIIEGRPAAPLYMTLPATRIVKKTIKEQRQVIEDGVPKVKYSVRPDQLAFLMIAALRETNQ